MPAVVAAVPSALYVIVGATHPDLLHREGEAYRQMLQSTADRLGVSDNVPPDADIDRLARITDRVAAFGPVRPAGLPAQ
jgi:hypothetical protein